MYDSLNLPLTLFSQDKTAFDFQTKGNDFLQKENYTEAIQNYNQAIEIYSMKNDLPNTNIQNQYIIGLSAALFQGRY